MGVILELVRGVHAPRPKSKGDIIMKKTEIKAMSNAELLSSALWNQVRMTNEVNSRRGLTKQTAKEERWFIDEMMERFGIDREEFEKHYCK